MIVFSGGGFSDLDSLCADLNMPAPMAPSNYTSLLTRVKDTAESQDIKSMKSAAAEHKLAKQPDKKTIDCSEMFEGHSSLQRAVTCISPATGKVLDYSVLNKMCTF